MQERSGTRHLHVQYRRAGQELREIKGRHGWDERRSATIIGSEGMRRYRGARWSQKRKRKRQLHAEQRTCREEIKGQYGLVVNENNNAGETKKGNRSK